MLPSKLKYWGEGDCLVVNVDTVQCTDLESLIECYKLVIPLIYCNPCLSVKCINIPG